MSSGLLAALLALATASSAAPVPAAGNESGGIVRSVMTSTHITFGKLGIGALATQAGAYFDAKEVRREGVHARLSITVAKDPDARREVALAVGDAVEIAGYRIKVEAISPGDRGSASLRLWAPPPQPAKPAKKWPFSWFGLGGK